MKVTERLKTILPDDIDKESKNEEKRQQTIKALSIVFRDSVKSKGTSGIPLENVIQNLSIKDINDIFFDDTVPNAPGRHYNGLIEEFLSGPEFYKKEIEIIVDGYLSIVSDLQERVQRLILEGKTDEQNPDYRSSTATYLDARLTSICERTKLVLSVYKDVDQLHEQLGKIASSVNTLSGEVTGISTTSEQIMPNIISLLGVFSSIIVVILSLITTSSTWLSNANDISVLIAFVVPAGIITLAVCALTALIRSLLDSQTNGNKAQSKDTKPWWVKLWSAITQMFKKWGLWLFIVIVTSLIICGTISYCQDTSDDQIHYIVKCLPSTEPQEDSNDAVDSTSEKSEQELFIIQEIILPTGETYLEKIPCADGDKHSDGFVYYCLLHQRFE